MGMSYVEYHKNTVEQKQQRKADKLVIKDLKDQIDELEKQVHSAASSRSSSPARAHQAESETEKEQAKVLSSS